MKFLLIVIILFAAFLRLFALDKYPVSLFGDEVDVGYHAYSLLKTGKDYMGQTLPSYIHSLAEWRAPLFIYSAVPTIALLGLNEWGVRLPAAIFGVLGVFLVYKLGARIKDERFGLIAALLLAITPWHIHYSRAAFEVTLLLDLVLSGTLFYLQKRYFLSGLFFALTPYTYSTAVIFTPLYFFGLYFLQKDSIRKLASFALPILILAVPFIFLYFSGQSSSRFSLLSIFNSEQLINSINIERNETKGASERLFHNKLVGWTELFAANYVKSFSPEFNFISGDPLPRHNVPGSGELLWGFLPLLLAGVAYLFSKEEKSKYLVFLWLALASVPAALTIDGGTHATRLFLRLPPLVFISAFGFLCLWQSNKRALRLVGIATVVLLGLNLVWWVHRYVEHYTLNSWKYWHYGYKEAMLSLAGAEPGYERVFINNTYEPSLLHFLFWTKYDPARFQQEFAGDIPQEGVYPGFNGFSLGNKYYFGETQDLFSILGERTLYLAAQQKEIPGDWDFEKSPPQVIKVFRVVRNPQGQPLFSLVTKE